MCEIERGRERERHLLCAKKGDGKRINDVVHENILSLSTLLSGLVFFILASLIKFGTSFI